MYNTLLTYASAPGDTGTQLVPDMATEVPTVANGGITNDGKTYTFHLHAGHQVRAAGRPRGHRRGRQVLDRAHAEPGHAAGAAGRRAST